MHDPLGLFMAQFRRALHEGEFLWRYLEAKPKISAELKLLWTVVDEVTLYLTELTHVHVSEVKDCLLVALFINDEFGVFH